MLETSVEQPFSKRLSLGVLSYIRTIHPCYRDTLNASSSESFYKTIFARETERSLQKTCRECTGRLSDCGTIAKSVILKKKKIIFSCAASFQMKTNLRIYYSIDEFRTARD